MAFQVNHPKNKPGENIYTYKTSIQRSDLVTVSTPYLADRFKSMGITNVEVIKNTVDVSRFTPKQHTDSDVPQVGWVGSTDHRSGDLETMKGLLVPMVRSGKITLYHGGHTPYGESFASRIGATEDEVVTAPMCPHDEYPNLLTMDIGIVPLSNLPFNRAKSDIKGLEYAAAGVPFIAQNLDAYVELANSTGIGRPAKNAQQWKKHIEALRNPELRAEEGAEYREVIRITRDISIGIRHFIDIIESV
jgi:glycosyltransferase involved in cell wall biosynthesis